MKGALTTEIQSLDRIKELAEQAIKFIPDDASHEKGLAIFIEKYSLLIIKECGVVLRPRLRDMISRGTAFNLIKEHFGVEK